IAPTDPQKLLREELAARLRATEGAIARLLGNPRDGAEARRLAGVGVARLFLLLKRAEVAHPVLKSRHGQESALITLSDRLVTNAATLEVLPRTAPGQAERAELEHFAESCTDVRHALENGGTPEPARPPAPGAASVASPVLAELEDLVDLMRQALGPE